MKTKSNMKNEVLQKPSSPRCLQLKCVIVEVANLS